MKKIVILWNSVSEIIDLVLKDINKFVIIQECYQLDLKKNMSSFIKEVYDYNNLPYKWHVDEKIKSIENQYDNNYVNILLIEDYNKQENFKYFIRDKYKVIIKNYCFDNIIHVTDNKDDYFKLLLVIKKYIEDETKEKKVLKKYEK